LLFHYLILLQAKNLKLNDIEQELMRRVKLK
jgi:phosphoribosyl-AMP cyclohydrolase / phosphoribosyl-ATP pyrophosphohydrolase